VRALRQQQQAPAPLVQVTDDAAQQPWALDAWVGARLVCTSCHGHILFTSITPAWLLSKSAKTHDSGSPRGLTEQEQRTQERRWQTGGQPRPCVHLLHHSCFVPRPPRCHRNILIWIFAGSPAVCSRVRPLACILSQIASRSRARSRPLPVGLRDVAFATIFGRALLRDDDGEAQPLI